MMIIAQRCQNLTLGDYAIYVPEDSIRITPISKNRFSGWLSLCAHLLSIAACCSDAINHQISTLWKKESPWQALLWTKDMMQYL